VYLLLILFHVWIFQGSGGRPGFGRGGGGYGAGQTSTPDFA